MVVLGGAAVFPCAQTSARLHQSDIGYSRIKLGILALVVFILCFSIAPIVG